MPVSIIESFQLGTNLPLDNRYVVENINDVSLYWHDGMLIYETAGNRLFIVKDSSAEIVKEILDSSSNVIISIDQSLNDLQIYIDGSLYQRDLSINALFVENDIQDSSIIDLRNRINVTDSSLSSLTALVNIHEASIGFIEGDLIRIDGSIVYIFSELGQLESSIIRIDSSINVLFLENDIQDASIIRIDSSLVQLNSWSAQLDASIIRIDSSINALFLENDIQDASIIALRAEDVRQDGSLNLLFLENDIQDASIIRIDTSLGQLNDWSAQLDASIRRIDASLYDYVRKDGDTMTGPLILDSSLRVLEKASFLSDVDIKGDLRVDGSTTFIHTNIIDVSGPFINLNTGLTGSPPAWLQSGMIIERGDASSYAFIFDETRQEFRVGIVNAPDPSNVFQDLDTQAVATREDTPVPTAIPFWNGDQYRFDTSAGLTFTNDLMNISSDVSILGELCVKQTAHIDSKIHFHQYDNIDASWGDLWVDPCTYNLYYKHPQIDASGIDASSYDLTNRLLRTEDDWSEFPDSSVLVEGDRILIEQAASGFKKAWISSSAFAQSIGVLSFAAYDASLSISSTTATAYQRKLLLTTDASAKAGVFRIGWTLQLTNSNNAKNSKYRVRVEDVSIVLDEDTITFSTGESYQTFAGFQHVYLPDGSHNISVDYSAVTNTARIKSVRLEYQAAQAQVV